MYMFKNLFKPKALSRRRRMGKGKHSGKSPGSFGRPLESVKRGL